MNRIKLIYLSIFCGLISILSFFNITYSYYLNFYLNLNTYIFTFFISLLFTVLFYISNNDDEKKTTIYEKILTILVGYFLLPLLISIPFYFSIYNLTFINSYFEAISGFTSTGFTTFDNIKYVDPSLISPCGRGTTFMVDVSGNRRDNIKLDDFCCVGINKKPEIGTK